MELGNSIVDESRHGVEWLLLAELDRIAPGANHPRLRGDRVACEIVRYSRSVLLRNLENVMREALPRDRR